MPLLFPGARIRTRRGAESPTARNGSGSPGARETPQAASEEPLTAEEVRRFEQDGYLSLPHAVLAPAEVSRLQTVILGLFERQAGAGEGALLGIEAADLGLSRSLEIVRPLNYAPELADSEFHRWGLRVARQLLGATAYQRFEHAILKPALVGTETQWHQDEAYRREADWDYQALAIWMPLQPATVDNGCMRYVAGSHRGGLKRHQPVGPDHLATAIECAEPVDPEAVRCCPLDAGGVTLHAGRTLHAAGPNRSTGGRVAYILNFEALPVRRRVPREVPWLDRLQGAERRRRRSWLLRGGFAVELGRMVGTRQHPHLRSMISWLRKFSVKRPPS